MLFADSIVGAVDAPARRVEPKGRITSVRVSEMVKQDEPCDDQETQQRLQKILHGAWLTEFRQAWRSS
jgi:hypothetical protein